MRYRAWQTFSAQSRRLSHRADRVAEVAPRPAFACRQCGAGLKWSPGDEQLACPYCGALNDAPAAAAAIAELDYHTHLAQVATE
ncbi:hypothetical protein BH23GEM5_BH23GEM5_15820 [soil metagenome]